MSGPFDYSIIMRGFGAYETFLVFVLSFLGDDT